MKDYKIKKRDWYNSNKDKIQQYEAKRYKKVVEVRRIEREKLIPEHSKRIPNYPNYTISKEGKVWSIVSCKYLTQFSNKSLKYLTVGLSNIDKCNKTLKVHRLILETYIGPCPEGMECCHNNGNRFDNRLKNLRWDSLSNNMEDKIKHNKQKKSILKE